MAKAPENKMVVINGVRYRPEHTEKVTPAESAPETSEVTEDPTETRGDTTETKSRTVKNKARTSSASK